MGTPEDLRYDEHAIEIREFLEDKECLFAAGIWPKRRGGVAIRWVYGPQEPTRPFDVVLAIVTILQGTVSAAAEATNMPERKIYDAVIDRLREKCVLLPRYD